MRSPQENWTKSKLEKLADAIWRKPLLFIWPQVLLALLSLGYAFSNLKFSGNRADLVSENVKYQRDFRRYKQEFQHPDPMVAVVESESLDKNRRFVERLAVKLEQEPELFSGTYFKGDLRTMGRKGLLFLSEEMLEQLHSVLEREWPFIEAHSKVESFNGVVQEINREFRESELDQPQNMERLARTLPILRRTIEEAAQCIANPVSNSFPGMGALFGDQTQLYVTFAAGQMYAVVTHAATPQVNAEAVRRLRQLVTETSMEVPGVNAGISGEPVLDHDEMEQAQRDISLASLYSLGIVALIFIYGFHETTRPLLASISLLVGISFALGFTTLSVGRLNLLTITLVPMLIGLAIDFAVHLISRYEEDLKFGASRQEAFREALPMTGVGILTSALTTAGAFLAMVLTDFKGIQEMGFVSGMGLLLCVVPMMTFLPALLARERSKVTAGVRTSPARSRKWLQDICLDHPGKVVISGAVLTLLALSQFPRLEFDYNLLNLQSSQLPAVGIEEKLIRSGSESFLNGMVMADSLEQAAELESKLKQLPMVKDVSSLVSLFSENQARKLELVTSIKSKAEKLQLSPLNPGPVDVDGLNESLFALEGYLGLSIEYITENKTGAELLPELEALRQNVIRLRSYTAIKSPEMVERLTEFEKTLFGTLHETIALIRDHDVSGRLELKDVPAFLRERFVSASGKFLLQVLPRGDVWQRKNQEQFINQVRTVVPNVTGTVVQIYEYTSLLRKNFIRASAYAAAIIAVVLLVDFRRFSSVVLALIPVGLGLCWLAGLMAALNLSFNPVNIMSLTLLIGIGVANGIHILSRFMEDPHPEVLSKSTGKAILVSALTTMAGFGSLVISKHHGIASLGMVMALGTFTCLAAAVCLLPSVLVLLNRRKR